MVARALIVLLLVLNAGVATWWVMRPPESPSRAPTQPAGVPRLRLLREAPKPPLPSIIVAAAPAPTAAPQTTAATRCFAFGPFDDDSSVDQARASLQAQALQLRVRPVPAITSKGWRVWLPPLPDRASAQALAARIKAGGFPDNYIVTDGPEANSIALGRYRNEAMAQQHATALQAAGFAAQAQSLDASAATQWIDIAASAAFDARRARDSIAAAQVRPLDCANLLPKVPRRRGASSSQPQTTR